MTDSEPFLDRSAMQDVILLPVLIGGRIDRKYGSRAGPNNNIRTIREQQSSATAQIEAWKCNFPSFRGNYYSQANQLTKNQQTNQTDGHVGS